MHFGRNDIDLAHVDFHLPADSGLTSATLQQAPAGNELKVYVGAPKWGYKHWLGRLYPRGTKDADFLRAYARHFNAVELGATFYDIPPPERMIAWQQMVQQTPDFKCCPKFPQTITHLRRFRNVEEQTGKFYASVSALGTHLGPLLLQLPDNYTPNTFGELKAYLESLPTAFHLCVEVRNKNWFAVPGHRNQLFNLLNGLNIGAVIADTPGRRDCLHMELTTPHAFIRFVHTGNAAVDYRRLDEWVERLKDWKQQGLQSLYFFIHAGDTPDLALFTYFNAALNQQLGANLEIPGQLPE